MLLKFGLFRAALFTGCWWRNVNVSTLRNICINRKQPNFNCRTFSLIDIIETLGNYFACELTEVFKFLNGSYTVDADIFFEYDKGNSRGHSKKLFERWNRLDIRKYVFGNRVTDKWNNLQQCCINCTTLNNFKSQSHRVLQLETE